METLQKQAVRKIDDGAKSILKQNLRALMEVHPILKTREALSKRTRGVVSQRTIGSMLNGGGNPTLANIEAVAQAYHLEAWELLMPTLDVAGLAKSISPAEAALHQQIEAAMRHLGVTEYKLARKR